jgi:hypothetical protein
MGRCEKGTYMYTVGRNINWYSHFGKQDGSSCPSADEGIKMDHNHIVKNYSILENKEVLPFAAILVSLENIMLSGTSQTQTNSMGSHLYVED